METACRGSTQGHMEGLVQYCRRKDDAGKHGMRLPHGGIFNSNRRSHRRSGPTTAYVFDVTSCNHIIGVRVRTGDNLFADSVTSVVCVPHPCPRLEEKKRRKTKVVRYSILAFWQTPNSGHKYSSKKKCAYRTRRAYCVTHAHIARNDKQLESVSRAGKSTIMILYVHYTPSSHTLASNRRFCSYICAFRPFLSQTPPSLPLAVPPAHACAPPVSFFTHTCMKGDIGSPMHRPFVKTVKSLFHTSSIILGTNYSKYKAPSARTRIPMLRLNNGNRTGGCLYAYTKAAVTSRIV